VRPPPWLHLRRLAASLAIGLVGLAGATSALGQQLAFRSYQVSDGLAHGVVIGLHQDAKGYLWLATYEGLSRFDGYQFTTYGMREGLGHFVVNDVTSDREGRIWVALNGGGVARLLDTAPPTSGTRVFGTYNLEADAKHPANAVNRLLFDADNRLWCATDAGVYRARNPDVLDRGFERVVPGAVPYFNNAAFADRRGRLWFGVGSRVIQIAGGITTTYQPGREAESGQPQPLPAWTDIHSLIEDDRGRILAAETTGIYEFVEPSIAGARGTWRRWPIDFPPASGIRAITPAPDGATWIGTTAGLVRRDADGRTIRYTTANGLPSNHVRSLLRDREGSLWIGTEGAGVSRFAGESVVTYTSAQALPAPDVHHLTQDRDGRLYALVGCAPRTLVRIGDDEVRAIPSGSLTSNECYKSHLLRDPEGHTWYHTKAHASQDARGRWWFHTRRGLESAPGPDLRLDAGRPIGEADGFPEHFYSELYHDPDGQIWAVNGVTGRLYVANGADERPRFHLVTTGLTGAELLLRDRSGTLWIASSDTIWRWREHALTTITSGEGLPAIEPRVLFQDGAGRVWIGLRYHGVSMTADPGAATPHFVNYNTSTGLASDTVWSISADDDGHAYLGTGRGLDQLDIASGRVRHFTAQDGVIGSVIEHILRDRRGRLWIASDAGLTRLDPRAMTVVAPRAPPIFISRVQIAGEDWPVPPTGAARLDGIALPAARNNLTIRFVGLSYRNEKLLRYQYKLEGAAGAWSAPSEERVVEFAHLAPGRYRFAVRALSRENLPSEQPAVVEFHILPPIYLRAWFIALIVLATAGSGYALYRHRIARLLEIERVRMRIAGDLHDDIGANLTKISVLSEVARQQQQQQQQQTGTTGDGHALASIARMARESISSMSDIVWAVNPRRDSLADLAGRMRLHAEEACLARGIALEFVVPDRPDLQIDLDVRRDLYLIFKEAVNNAARHSACTQLSIALARDRETLVLTVQDNGRGFDPGATHDGDGLVNMRRRAVGRRGSLNIESTPGASTGTTVRFSIRHRPTSRSR
jgi:signal transduction histidine kinase/ligand-binding sensor domain-containing protein